jgi:membrane-bound lytic murein transglycosylase A
MIAQDTGGAIIGPARADIYFGAGDEAATIAGRLRHSGRFTMLVPKELGPKTVKERVPLPPRRPGSSAQMADAKASAKSKSAKTGKVKP